MMGLSGASFRPRPLGLGGWGVGVGVGVEGLGFWGLPGLGVWGLEVWGFGGLGGRFADCHGNDRWGLSCQHGFELHTHLLQEPLTQRLSGRELRIVVRRQLRVGGGVPGGWGLGGGCKHWSLFGGESAGV